MNGATGTFPPPLAWSYSYTLSSIPPNFPSTKPLLPKRRGRPPKHPVVGPDSPLAIEPCVFVCGWVSLPGSEELVPELWRLVLPSNDTDGELVCIGMRESVSELAMDLQVFCVVNGRFYLFGGEGDRYGTCLQVDVVALDAGMRFLA